MPALSEAIIPYDPQEWSTSAVSSYTVWQYAIRPSSSIIIVQTGVLTDGAREIVGKIKTFSDLPENWDSYGATPPSKTAVRNALSLVRSVDERRLPIFFTAPGPNGEVLVELKQGTRSIEFTFDSKGSSSYAKFEGVECLEENTLSDQNLSDLAAWLSS
ncbi:MAG: hypothetical protein ABSF91_04590 [Bacteroidota bacterium]|jgi:hypothetical protein